MAKGQVCQHLTKFTASPYNYYVGGVMTLGEAVVTSPHTEHRREVSGMRVKVSKPMDGRVRVKVEYRRVAGLGAEIHEDVLISDLPALIEAAKQKERRYIAGNPTTTQGA